MSTEAERINRSLRPAADDKRRTVVYEGELLRHGVYTRVIHWAVAIFFILSLLSGFAIFTPWLYAWVAPVFGGGAITRLLHPWFGLGFLFAFILQLVNWLRPMRWSDNDRRWLRRLGEYSRHDDKLEPEYVGKFNAGQKLWFWAIFVSAIVFLLTGIVMWWPEVFGRVLMWISYFFHDIAALVLLGGFIIHIYQATAAMPGTFRSMTRGTVTDRWAWTHHPAWYRELTGRDPRTDYEREHRLQTEHRRMLESWEREQDARDTGE
ncbi:MAG: formate dehydrogenase subunit gamma [Acidobacteria bacterium]|nr:formate dehydrogenase subunit gamma [Acidobacteriota bacterium]